MGELEYLKNKLREMNLPYYQGTTWIPTQKMVEYRIKILEKKMR